MTFSSLALDEGGQFIFKRSGGKDNIRNDTVESRRYITPLPPKTRPSISTPAEDSENRSLVLPMPSF